MELRANVCGFSRLFKLNAERLSDIREPLRETGAEIRDESKATFAEERSRSGEPWAPLAGATKERLAQTPGGLLNRKGQVRKKYIEQVSNLLRRQQKAGSYNALVGQEFYRLTHGGDADAAVDESVKGTFKRLRRELRKRQKLREAAANEPQVELEVYSDKPDGRGRVRIISPGYRKDARVAFPRDLRQVGQRFSVPASAITDVGGSHYRVAASAVPAHKSALKGHKLLGRLYAMIRLSVGKTGLRVGLLNKSPLAIHNEGGTAGRGAKIPPRTFIELLEEDIERLAERLVSWIVSDDE